MLGEENVAWSAAYKFTKEKTERILFPYVTYNNKNACLIQTHSLKNISTKHHVNVIY